MATVQDLEEEEDDFVRGLDEEVPLMTTVAADIRVDREAEIEMMVDDKNGYSRYKDTVGSVEMPDMIVDDWMYLGAMHHACAANVVEELGITHILNCSLAIPCYHIENESIEYARIPLDDVESSNIGSYFQAAADFIDQCNPKYTTSSTQNRILIHCAAGISRSSTTVISYLIQRSIDWNPVEKDCLNMIRNRSEIDKQVSGELDKLTLAVAYFHVKSCRSLIAPNDGFVEQLEKLEKQHHGGKSSRAYIPHSQYFAAFVDNKDDEELFQKIADRKERGAVIEPEPEPRRRCIIL